ncbi:MAG: hypothetical protein MJY44_01330 [Bacteroidales bacterium]|nr:hypothetical protein [Bacteroidales bacterium]
MKKTLYTIFAVITLVSCTGGRSEEGYEVSDEALRILEDPFCTEIRLLRACDRTVGENPIYVCGDALRARSLCMYLAEFDGRDNVDGSVLSDGLPDFSGEMIYGILDERVRPSALSSLAASLDTVFCVSRYDAQGGGSRAGAKILVFTSPLEVAQRRDVDTVVNFTGCALKTLFPLEKALEAAVADGAENICVISPLEDTVSQPYYRLIADAPEKCRIVAVSCDFRNAHPLFPALDGWIASGAGGRVDAFVLDGYMTDEDSFGQDVSVVRSALGEKSLKYAGLISERLKVYDTRRIAAGELFGTLRDDNSFAHRIAYPQVRYFAVVDTLPGGGAGPLRTVRFN